MITEDGLRGMTSNPAIFEKAIAGSDDYDAAIGALTKADKRIDQIYESLALEDIGMAADLLRNIYDESGGGDGYVSL